MDYRSITRSITECAKETAHFIQNESENFDLKKTENKGFNDFVSYVDKHSEEMLVEGLSNILPEAGFITEEGTSEKKGSRYCWIIDPLDGTTNFIHDLHPFSISIALMEYDEIIAGVVYEAGGNEVFTAWKNGGAWLNGSPVKVSGARKLSDSLIATGFPYSDFNLLDPYMDCLAYLCRNTHGIRRLGSASVDLAYVACGRFEAFYEYGLHTWDVAAGILLVREAGGTVSDFSGDRKNISGNEIVAANNHVFKEILEIVSKFMGK